MAEKEDRRVIRTKKALADAFIELLKQKPLDELTVNELCDVAGVRRATFYKHYSDKYAFLTAYTCALRDEFDTLVWTTSKPVHTKDYFVAYARRVVEFISLNEAAVENILKSNLFPSALSIIVEQNYKDTCDRLRDGVAMGMKLPASVEVTASMFAGGVSSAIYNWLYNGKKTPPDQLADEIGRFVEKVLDT